MTPRDAGFLACRVLGVVFLSWMVSFVPLAIQSFALADSMRGASGQIKRTLDLAPWANVATVVAFGIGSFVLWTYAGSLSAFFASRDEPSPSRPNSNPTLATGLALLGVYFFLRTLPDLFKEIEWFAEPHHQEMGEMPVTLKLQFFGTILLLAVSLALILRNFRVLAALNYPRPAADEPSE